MIAVGLMFALFLSVMNTSKCIKKQFFVEFFIVSGAFKLHRYVPVHKVSVFNKLRMAYQRWYKFDLSFSSQISVQMLTYKFQV